MTITGINITEFEIQEKEILVEFLSSGCWQFHSTPQIPKEKLLKQFESGYFTGSGQRTFLIKKSVDNLLIGVIRLFDLGESTDDDETPLFDIKIKEEFRGNGTGKKAVSWLTDFVFTNYPNKLRFEATTRIDNIAMRRVLEHCGFVKEAHYRLAWPDKEGNRYDCAGYGILRRDWEKKTITPVKWND